MKYRTRAGECPAAYSRDMTLLFPDIQNDDFQESPTIQQPNSNLQGIYLPGESKQKKLSFQIVTYNNNHNLSNGITPGDSFCRHTSQSCSSVHTTSIHFTFTIIIIIILLVLASTNSSS